MCYRDVLNIEYVKKDEVSECKLCNKEFSVIRSKVCNIPPS